MPDRAADPPTLVLDETGKIESANAAALELLGATLAQLRAAPRGAFAAYQTPAEEDAALRAQWEAAGRPQVAGETTIKRADGRLIRVRYLISGRADDGFVVILEPGRGSKETPATLFTLDGVLSQWRAAERRLAAVSPNSAEWLLVSGEIERLRTAYREGFRLRRHE